VTDIDMPGTNGFDLVAALRQDPHSAHLPVIALASAPTPQAVERARRLAIAEFVAKFDRSGLVAALAETQGRIGEAA
jgi:two-component system chemotaxis sensor kinase CheA